MPLEDDEELMAIFNEAGIDLRRGWRTLSESDETHLYGIPVDVLPGLYSLCYAENGYLAVLSCGIYESLAGRPAVFLFRGLLPLMAFLAVLAGSGS